MAQPPSSSPPAPDPSACQRVLRRLAGQGSVPWLHGEVARRMADRLQIMRSQPRRVLDWSLLEDGSTDLIKQAYPKAEVQQVRPVPGLPPPRPVSSRRWWTVWSGSKSLPTLQAADVPAQSAQLVWCNMLLHLMPQPALMLAQWHKTLQVDGFLMFSTLGPDTLRELRAVYGAAGFGPAHHPFEDMHDVGDRLVEAGFADPVMDQEQVTLTFAHPQALVQELRGLGGNTHVARASGLRTPRWQSRLHEALAARSDADGRIALTFEIVYGHAFRAADRVRVAGESVVGLERMRDMLRRPGRS